MQGNISELIKLIDEKADIEKIVGDYVSLERKGNNFVGLCPFHSDNSPSMSVSPSKKIFKCFSCGAGGSVINFVQNYEGISFVDSLKVIADKVGINWRDYLSERKVVIDKDLLKAWEINKEAFNFFSYNLENNAEANAYLTSRNITKEQVQEFKIGFAPRGDQLFNFLLKKGYSSKDIIDNGLGKEYEGKLVDIFQERVIFSIEDINGNIIGFSGRVMNNDSKYAKYLNSPETIAFKKNSILYNIANARKTTSLKKEVIVLEGFMDVIALSSLGVKNIVATMGTAFTEQHIESINQITRNITLCFDHDAPGINATISSGKKLLEKNMHVEVVEIEGAKDMDELIKLHPEHIAGYLTNKISFINFYKKIIFSILDKQGDNVNFEPIKELLKVLSSTKDELLIDVVINEISAKYNITREVLINLMSTKKVNETNQQKSKQVYANNEDYLNHIVNGSNNANISRSMYDERINIDSKKILTYLAENPTLQNLEEIESRGIYFSFDNENFQKLRHQIKSSETIDPELIAVLKLTVTDFINSNIEFVQTLEQHIERMNKKKREEIQNEINSLGNSENDIKEKLRLIEFLKKLK